MATRRRNPSLLGRAARSLWDEFTGERDRRALRARVERRPVAPSPRPVPRTRAYEPVAERRPAKRYRVVVKPTKEARSRPYQAVRKEEEFRDLADRAERGELTGDALTAFLNRYQVRRARA